MSYICLPYVVENFMPNYIQGLPSTKINLLTAASFVWGPSSDLRGPERNTPYLIFYWNYTRLFWEVVHFSLYISKHLIL
jgi:hypothetical protein